MGHYSVSKKGIDAAGRAVDDLVRHHQFARFQFVFEAAAGIDGDDMFDSQ